jgi:hypothetical protein
MSKLDSLIVLINSMDSTEKRYFGLQTKMYEGEKDYQLLFHIIQKTSLNTKVVKTEFKKLRPNTSFDIICNHLYYILLDKLSAKDTENEIEFQVLKAYQRARFLLKRNLFEECFQVIKKYKSIALEYELFSHFLLLAKLEIKTYNQLEFNGLDEDSLIKKQAKIESVSRQQRAIENHTGLYNLITIRQIKQGLVRNEAEKEKLNDLAFNELQANSGQSKDSFEAKKLHLLFQSAYFMKTANPKSSLKVYYELNDLFENNRKLWGNPPFLYFNHLRGILNNLRWFGHYNEMPYFIEKMKNLVTEYPSTKSNIQYQIFIFESLILTDQHHFEESLNHLTRFETEFSDSTVNLQFVSHTGIALQIATVYFWNKEYKKALKTIRPLLNAGKPFNQLPQTKSMRFINILIHFKLNDSDYLESEIRSFERDLNKKNVLFKTEEIILKGIKQYNKETDPIKKKNGLLLQKDKLIILKEDPYENQLLKTFDFIYWLEQMANS